MNKIPAKQIYLLLVIIVGIIALSVYSTYAIFTFESETSEAFNIKLPSALEIKTDMYEYKQIEIPANSLQTTDIDLYNTYDYELCYSIWYKVLSNEDYLVNLYEISDTNLNASGTIMAQEKSRFTLLITNDSDQNIKINLGLAAVKATETCSLKLSSDKKNIREVYNQELVYLNDKIISTSNQVQNTNIEESLIYKNQSVELSFPNSVTIANKYTIKNNRYVLLEPQTVSVDNYQTLLANIDYQTTNYYLCNTPECHTIYRINSASLSTTNNKLSYFITNVDEYEVVEKGTSGLKKINNNYYYYGDNPNNFIYYNCQDNHPQTCELWRIIGLIYDETTHDYKLKIIRNDSLGTYQYNNTVESNIWSSKNSQSTLYHYLNHEYTLSNSLMSAYSHTFETITSQSVSLKDIQSTKITTTNNEVTLMNLTDYINASSCKQDTINNFLECRNNNWLNRLKISKEWTLTAYQETNISVPIIDETITNDEVANEELTDETTINNSDLESENNQTDEIPIVPEQSNVDNATQTTEHFMYTVGNAIEPTLVSSEANVRPVVYLKERALYYSGDGTLNNPYIIK